MPAIQDFLGLATTLVILGLIAGGVMKLFQIAGDMQEIKEALKDMRRGGGLTSPAAAPIPAALPSAASPGLASLASAVPPAPAGLPTDRDPTPEELVRDVHAQDFRGDDFPL